MFEIIIYDGTAEGFPIQIKAEKIIRVFYLEWFWKFTFFKNIVPLIQKHFVVLYNDPLPAIIVR